MLSSSTKCTATLSPDPNPKSPVLTPERQVGKRRVKSPNDTSLVRALRLGNPADHRLGVAGLHAPPQASSAGVSNEAKTSMYTHHFSRIATVPQAGASKSTPLQ